MSVSGRIKGAVKNWAARKGYSVEKILPAERRHGKAGDLRFAVAEFIIESVLRSDPEAVAVQIGAFDGKSNDFLFDVVRKHPVKTILVEPQPEAFKLLCRNYADMPRVVTVNAAMAWKDQSMSLYRIRTEYHGSFRLAPQLASFDRQHLVNALSVPHLEGLPADRDQCIELIEVEGISFSTLLQRYRLGRIDVLQIDTEGFDYEIVKMIDFKQICPRVINFEIVHLSHSELDAAVELLVSNGYRTLRYGINMVALHASATSAETHFFEGSTFAEAE